MKFLAALIPAFMNMLTTLIGKVLTALGITAVVYVGLESIISQLKSEIQSSLSGVPAGVLEMFYLAGGGTVLNIFFGCFTFVLAFKSLAKFVSKGKT
ncbi:DUF2523 domain-containing protein [Kingella negevensis]|uniref:DUF2523 domain-containing protein n=1 Tax=Kingella negevensis TaxID=1522312 RepID=UPI00050A0758|nr:DUF2523 domain-containing protein [Kingella negevensis]